MQHPDAEDGDSDAGSKVLPGALGAKACCATAWAADARAEEGRQQTRSESSHRRAAILDLYSGLIRWRGAG